MNELKQRGIKDILIICSDNLTGIKEANNAAYPNTVQQRCIVHMIRNSVKFVNYKDLKEFTNDLKKIYTSVDEEKGYEQLQEVKINGLINIYQHLKLGKKTGMQFVHSFNSLSQLEK